MLELFLKIELLNFSKMLSCELAQGKPMDFNHFVLFSLVCSCHLDFISYASSCNKNQYFVTRAFSLVEGPLAGPSSICLVFKPTGVVYEKLLSHV